MSETAGVDRERRRFLRQAGCAAAVALLPPGLRDPRAAGPGLLGPPARGGGGTGSRRVVFLVFAGGVRSRETIGMPAAIPHLSRIAAGGFLLRSVHTAGGGHGAATRALLTGCETRCDETTGQPGDRTHVRRHPTVFERLRRDGGLPPEDVWLVAPAGVESRDLGVSEDPAYGPVWGPISIDAANPIPSGFEAALRRAGAPPDSHPAREARIHELRGALRPASAASDPDPTRNPDQRTRAADLLASLAVREPDRPRTGDAGHDAGGRDAQGRGAAGPLASDRQALRLATSILVTVRPRCLTVVLFGADIAHRSFADYVEVIRARDREIGRLFDAVRARPELRDDTAILVVPAFGRDHAPNARGGLDHGDRSEDHLRVAAFGYGPRIFRHDAARGLAARTVDFAPTVLAMLGVPAPPDLDGRALDALLLP